MYDMKMVKKCVDYLTAPTAVKSEMVSVVMKNGFDAVYQPRENFIFTGVSELQIPETTVHLKTKIADITYLIGILLLNVEDISDHGDDDTQELINIEEDDVNVEETSLKTLDIIN